MSACCPPLVYDAQKQQQQQPQPYGCFLKGPAAAATSARMWDTCVREEWASVSKIHLAHPNCWDSATLRRGNASKNRYPNVLPYSATRVRLGRHREATLDNCDEDNHVGHDDDYINANLVHAPWFDAAAASPAVARRLTRSEDNLRSAVRPDFIATQAPLPHTTSDFWLMVWQQQSPIIVTLCNLVEAGKSKCARYWPDEGTTRDYRGTLVHLQRVMTMDGLIARHFLIKRGLDGQEVRSVIQLHYTDWPDFGVPELAQFRNLMAVFNHFRARAREAGRMGPSVVHCSAGIGRTGTFLATQYCAEALARGEVARVQDTVTHLRHQRVGMVQTRAQYAFVYKVLAELSPAVQLQATPTSTTACNTAMAQSACMDESDGCDEEAEGVGAHGDPVSPGARPHLYAGQQHWLNGSGCGNSCMSSNTGRRVLTTTWA